MLSQDSEDEIRSRLRYDFGKMNSTLGSVVPLAMFLYLGVILTEYQGRTVQKWRPPMGSYPETYISVNVDHVVITLICVLK